jgi:hypothetical protein
MRTKVGIKIKWYQILIASPMGNTILKSQIDKIAFWIV